MSTGIGPDLRTMYKVLQVTDMVASIDSTRGTIGGYSRVVLSYPEVK